MPIPELFGQVPDAVALAARIVKPIFRPNGDSETEVVFTVVAKVVFSKVMDFKRINLFSFIQSFGFPRFLRGV